MKIGNHGMMIGIRQGEFPALQHLKKGVGQDIIDPQGWRKMGKGPANAKSFLNKSVLAVPADMGINIGIGHIVKIPANNGREWTPVQLRPDGIGLPAPKTISTPEFFDDRPGGLQEAVIDIYDNIQVMVILAVEEDRLQVSGEYAKGLISYLYIRSDQAFSGLKCIQGIIPGEQGLEYGVL